jgi:hypothetical protein
MADGDKQPILDVLQILTELARSLKENHAASNDLWQEAIEATLSYANERG